MMNLTTTFWSKKEYKFHMISHVKVLITKVPGLESSMPATPAAIT